MQETCRKAPRESSILIIYNLLFVTRKREYSMCIYWRNCRCNSPKYHFHASILSEMFLAGHNESNIYLLCSIYLQFSSNNVHSDHLSIRTCCNVWLVHSAHIHMCATAHKKEGAPLPANGTLQIQIKMDLLLSRISFHTLYVFLNAFLAYIYCMDFFLSSIWNSRAREAQRFAKCIWKYEFFGYV